MAGPVGAAGTKPLLAWPTPAPAQVAAGAAQDKQQGAVGAKTLAGGRRDPIVGADGFTQVDRGGGGKQASSACSSGDKTGADSAKLEPQQGTAGGGGGSGDEEQGSADAEMDLHDGDPIGDSSGDAAPSRGEALDQAPAADSKEQADPEVLKLRWEREKELLDLLRRQGRDEGDPTLVDAERRCEAAKAEWDAARGPQRMSRPLGRAEAAVYKARARQAAAEQAIGDLDAEYEAKRAEFQQELAEARRSTKLREAELVELQRSVARGSSQVQANDDDGAVVDFARRLDGIAPKLQALLAKLTTGTEEHASVVETISALAGVAGAASQAAARRREPRAQQFHIGGNKADDAQSIATEVEAGAGEEQHYCYYQRGAGGYQHDQWYGGGSHHSQYNYGGGYWTGGQGGWYGNDGWGATQYPAQPAAAAGAAQLVEGRAEVSTGNAGAWADDAERRRAEQAYADQQAAQSAGFATPQAAAAAAEVHAKLVAEIRQQAEANGVSCADVDLDNMPTAQLEDWKKANIRPGQDDL
jgi:hypothetical protein